MKFALGLFVLGAVALVASIRYLRRLECSQESARWLRVEIDRHVA